MRPIVLLLLVICLFSGLIRAEEPLKATEDPLKPTENPMKRRYCGIRLIQVLREICGTCGIGLVTPMPIGSKLLGDCCYQDSCSLKELKLRYCEPCDELEDRTMN